MALHKEFAKKVWELRQAQVHQILGPEGIGIFATDNEKPRKTTLSEIHDIISTIDFLKDEGYIKIQTGPSRGQLSLTGKLPEYEASNTEAVLYAEKLLREYKDEHLIARVSLSGFINDGYKTVRQIDRRRTYRINGALAIAALVSAVSASASAVLALPYFSNKIDNIQVKVDAIEASIKGIYSAYTLETFCYDQLKDSFKDTTKGTFVDIPLRGNPVPNSINVWEGALSVAPAYFSTNGKIVEVSTGMDAAALKDLCATQDFKYTVTYIPEDKAR